MEYTDNDILKYLQSSGMINVDDVRNEMRESERRRLLGHHKYKITYSEKEGRYRTMVPDETKANGRKPIAKARLEDLENELIHYYAKLEDESYIKENLSTLAKLFPYWIEYKSSLTKASSYVKRIICDWNKYYKDTAIVDLPLSDLTYLRLNEWAHTLVKKHNLTKKQYYNLALIMRQCLDYASEPEMGLIEANPFVRVKIKGKFFYKKQKPKSKTQVYQIPEQELICEAAHRKFEARPWCMTPLLVLLNFHLGLRIGELCALKWSDIEGNYINIRRMETTTFILDAKGVCCAPAGYKIVEYTKSEAGERPIYLNKAARDLLKQIKELSEKYGYYDDNYIFIKSRYNERGTSRTFTKYLEDLCKSCGIVIKRNHKIRKTCISSWLDAGVNINTAREMAGHEDEKTTLNNYCYDKSGDEILEKQLEITANPIMCF